MHQAYEERRMERTSELGIRLHVFPSTLDLSMQRVSLGRKHRKHSIQAKKVQKLQGSVGVDSLRNLVRIGRQAGRTQ
jgi:hypothetical protein